MQPWHGSSHNAAVLAFLDVYRVSRRLPFDDQGNAMDINEKRRVGDKIIKVDNQDLSDRPKMAWAPCFLWKLIQAAFNLMQSSIYAFLPFCNVPFMILPGFLGQVFC